MQFGFCQCLMADLFVRWRARHAQNSEGVVQLVSLKLTCDNVFNARDRDHLFALLSQRIPD